MTKVSIIVVEIKQQNDLEEAVSTTRNFAHTIPYSSTLPLQTVCVRTLGLFCSVLEYGANGETVATREASRPEVRIL